MRRRIKLQINMLRPKEFDHRVKLTLFKLENRVEICLRCVSRPEWCAERDNRRNENSEPRILSVRSVSPYVFIVSLIAQTEWTKNNSFVSSSVLSHWRGARRERRAALLCISNSHLLSFYDRINPFSIFNFN